MYVAILKTIFYVIVFYKVICFTVWMVEYISLRKKLSVIPGPKSYLFLGNTLELVRTKTEDLHKWVRKTTFSYEKGIFVMWIGTTPRVHIRKPHQMEVVLPNSKLIQKSETYDRLRDWLGNGLLTSNGKDWFFQRRLITPAFHFGILNEFADHMAQKAEVLNECIKERVDKDPNKPIDIFELACRCTLETICETAMGINENVQRKPDNEYSKTIQRFSRLTAIRFVRPWLKSDVIYNLTENGKEYRRVIDIMQNFTLNVIKRKQKNRTKDTQDGDSETIDISAKKRVPFLDKLLATSESLETPLSTQEIREQVDTFMFAGHDTTAVAISWTLFALGNNPDVQEKVHEEIENVLREDDSLITQQQLMELKYLDRVVKEGLRFYPSAPIISRRLAEDTTIDNVVIPKGTYLAMNIECLHHDPEVWEDPEKFDPDRFLPENSQNRHPYAYLPFSAGPRNCIGQKFALLEMKMVLATVLRKWKVKSLIKTEEMNLLAEIILRPRGRIDLFFIPKK